MMTTRHLTSLSKRFVVFSSALVPLMLTTGTGSQARGDRGDEGLVQGQPARPAYTISQTGTFDQKVRNGPLQAKTVLLLRDSHGAKPLILFQTHLRVNTDGSPLSYHPQDPLGRDKALNNICNAIAVRRVGEKTNLCLTEFKAAIDVFEKFRDTKYQKIPDGFQITWTNVLATVKDQGKNVPCVFTSGPFIGYFGSLTALRNGLTTNKGECDINDQVNPVTVPALVLAGGDNVMKRFGARVGDLLFAFDPGTGRFSAAIIGDTGPADNLGEGSVFLNMQLLGTTAAPSNKADTFKLSIEDTQVLVAIIPTSRSFQQVKPYTKDNIDARVTQWQKEAGFAAPEQFIELMKSFQPRLK